MSPPSLPPSLSPDAEANHRTKGLLRLTMACNERCPFCNVPVEDYPRPTPPDAAIHAELDAFVASGERTLTLSGGEPTLLRSRLLRVIREARARGIPFVELQTNAVLIDPPYARALADAGLTSAFVSLLSDVPALHDELAGLGGAWPRCLAGIDALLEAGVRVTLNPVVARVTQDRVADYVEFVAARLPGVRSISLSAVQPHGRARADLELLPDYAVLGPAVREARLRAQKHGIELLNPYCGLPLCVGWEGAMDASVEAQEALGGGWRETPGIENTGDKRLGPGCGACVLRGRCGGAWHAYWDVRGGSGLVPPAVVGGPWAPGSAEAVVRWGPGAAVASRAEPFVWVLVDALSDLPAAAASAPAGIALAAPAAWDREALRALRAVARAPRRPVLWIVVADLVRWPDTLAVARALGLDAVCLAVPDVQQAAARALVGTPGVEVRVIHRESRG